MAIHRDRTNAAKPFKVCWTLNGLAFNRNGTKEQCAEWEASLKKDLSWINVGIIFKQRRLDHAKRLGIMKTPPVLTTRNRDLAAHRVANRRIVNRTPREPRLSRHKAADWRLLGMQMPLFEVNALPTPAKAKNKIPKEAEIIVKAATKDALRNGAAKQPSAVVRTTFEHTNKFRISYHLPNGKITLDVPDEAMDAIGKLIWEYLRLDSSMLQYSNAEIKEVVKIRKKAESNDI